ncbi:hypothetical protein [Streptomyces sp. NBC_01244]|uniref:hypothetical protein n=1 Tax=Streptomyces sp. NBC_01244 TaxID=2903797 RepID=UPI002E1074C0|nr:transposase [Streptomyces sp. NBC_01244]
MNTLREQVLDLLRQALRDEGLPDGHVTADTHFLESLGFGELTTVRGLACVPTEAPGAGTRSVA